MKIDPYKHEERWNKWKEGQIGRIKGLKRENSEIIIKFLEDMELGINISLESIKGPRSYLRLNALKSRISFLATRFSEVYHLDKITDLSEEQACRFFAEMRKGIIRRLDGKVYKSTADYVKDFKAFWHWHQRYSKKRGIEVPDITMSLDTSKDKPKWVYLTEEQVKTLVEGAKYDYKVLILFLFDTGIRAPTELINIKVSDLFNDFKELQIRDEVSKTFGRRIKLMICSEILKDYVRDKKLEQEDYIFPIDPKNANRYLKRLCQRTFGDKLSPAGQKYSSLTLYDFRHISCCYWLPRYKSESALKYRFGWKKSEKIHYYSELLGMRDTITEEDVLIDTTKTELEQRLQKSEREKEVMQERLKTLEMQMEKILENVNRLSYKSRDLDILEVGDLMISIPARFN